LYQQNKFNKEVPLEFFCSHPETFPFNEKVRKITRRRLLVKRLLRRGHNFLGHLVFMGKIFLKTRFMGIKN
jgi:hypothetical protein